MSSYSQSPVRLRVILEFMIIGSFLCGQSRAQRFLAHQLTMRQCQSLTKLKFTFRNRLPMPGKIFLEMLWIGLRRCTVCVRSGFAYSMCTGPGRIQNRRIPG
jgi:hypothetical protein